MIVDTSAVIAVLGGEPDADLFTRAMAANHSRMAAGTYLECCIVVDRGESQKASLLFDNWMARSGIEVVDTTREQVAIARNAYRVFGKGSGSPAGLNYGDCFAYALAIALDEPLLWKGDDFTHTDVRSALV